MDLRDLVTFKKIIQLGNFAKAAEALNYAPSTVTAQVKALEKEYGILFERNAFGVSLTQRGQALLPLINQMLELNTSMLEIAQDDTRISGTLRLGTVETLCVHILPTVLRYFQKYYPQVDFSVSVAPSSELREMILANQVDLILSMERTQSNDNFCCGWSRKEEINLVVADQHPLAHKSVCDLSDIIQYPLVLSEKGCGYRQYLLNCFQTRKLTPNVFLEVGNTELIKNFILSGFAIGYLPQFTIRQEIQEKKVSILSVPDLEAPMISQLLYLNGTSLTPAMKKMIAIMNHDI